MTMETISTAISNLGSVVTTVVSTIASNPLLFMACVIPVFVGAIKVVKKLIKVK